ncbi:HAD-IIIC family phosphatase [Oscillatoria sp. CS-180]|uniref:HAD-IIIC family phosphatase n=1 Tax=Oscillatoria sp. CS-180 TaxID=3021720 RepID=UPI00232C774D|nr:HAD-IIIC family phosphatase [Oscillatoria sp. CS-180]MDB9527427.1 HAD-IIIC family phosphatase [Oscillatoria sp. CS-180]
MQMPPLQSTNTATNIVKCLVWDLDNTLWQGVLLENDEIILRDGALQVIQTLDSRGILQSVASKNDPEVALQQLRRLGLQDYFLYPQISWNSKVHSIQEIAVHLNIGTDAIAFIDDQPFELEEVNFSLTEVRCFHAEDMEKLVDKPDFNPPFVTPDAQSRRQMYLSNRARQQAEETFIGPEAAFLATLNMHLTIAPAQSVDLRRAEELTVRTHQLNTTGYSYSYEELEYFRQSNRHQLLMATLEDRFGSYGKIGLALLECQENAWIIKLLLMSCRVMSRGVGSIVLNHIIAQAVANQVKLYAEFAANDRNRMMYITYKFAGFREVKKQDGLTLLLNETMQPQPYPNYMTVSTTLPQLNP